LTALRYRGSPSEQALRDERQQHLSGATGDRQRPGEEELVGLRPRAHTVETLELHSQFGDIVTLPHAQYLVQRRFDAQLCAANPRPADCGMARLLYKNTALFYNTASPSGRVQRAVGGL
jgi:hypothetical protein